MSDIPFERIEMGLQWLARHPDVKTKRPRRPILGHEASIQQRQEHWVIADLVGKGGHVRTVPIPTWVKTARSGLR